MNTEEKAIERDGKGKEGVATFWLLCVDINQC